MLPAYLALPTCEEIREKLSDLIDSELDEPARARVRLHLAVCGRCGRLAAELSATVRALHALGHASGATGQSH